MHFQFIKPSGILAKYVRHYWILEAEASEGEVCERVVPTGNIELLFHYRKPFVMKHCDNTTTVQSLSMLGGMSNAYSDVYTQGEAGLLAVKFYPHGACNFFRFPLVEVENIGINLQEVFNKEIKRIEEQVTAAKDLQNRIAIIERFLISKLCPVKESEYLLLNQSIQYINSTGGQITARELCSKLATTPRSLERKFATFMGKSPKQFIRIVRFQEVLRRLSLGDKTYLTEYAYNNGYFDQSHFIKDFKSLSGYTPKEFVALGSCHSDYFG
ncbi:MAG TPA: helix-turn-helix transcriptional regulator [Bacteroidales bacterium]|nr:helix-turn-helix transcriptional regulator [Bacteroidales bacterium]